MLNSKSFFEIVKLFKTMKRVFCLMLMAIGLLLTSAGPNEASVTKNNDSVQVVGLYDGVDVIVSSDVNSVSVDPSVSIFIPDANPESFPLPAFVSVLVEKTNAGYKNIGLRPPANLERVIRIHYNINTISPAIA